MSVQYSTVQYSTVQYSTVQYSTVQYSTVQHSTVQYSTVQHCTVQHMHVHMSYFLCVLTCNLLKGDMILSASVSANTDPFADILLPCSWPYGEGLLLCLVIEFTLASFTFCFQTHLLE